MQTCHANTPDSELDTSKPIQRHVESYGSLAVIQVDTEARQASRTRCVAPSNLEAAATHGGGELASITPSIVAIAGVPNRGTYPGAIDLDIRNGSQHHAKVLWRAGHQRLYA